MADTKQTTHKIMRKAHQKIHGYSSNVDTWDVLDKNTLIRYTDLSHKEAIALQQSLEDAVIIHDH